MRLDLAAFRMIGKTPKAKAKPAKKAEAKKVLPLSKKIWELPHAKRKLIADSLIGDALATLKSFTAFDMVDETGLTLTSVRNKLNKLFDSGIVTKEKEGNGEDGPDKFYFKLIEGVS